MIQADSNPESWALAKVMRAFLSCPVSFFSFPTSHFNWTFSCSRKAARIATFKLIKILNWGWIYISIIITHLSKVYFKQTYLSIEECAEKAMLSIISAEFGTEIHQIFCHSISGASDGKVFKRRWGLTFLVFCKTNLTLYSNLNNFGTEVKVHFSFS